MTDLREFMKLVKLQFLQKPNNAFLSTLLYNFKIVTDSGERTISHDLTNQQMYINPDWFTSLSPAVAAGVLAEQLYHIGFLHEWRRGQRNPELYQQACDQVVRHMIQKSGFQLPEASASVLNDEYKNASTEVVYQHMEREYKGNPPNNQDDPLGHDVNKNSTQKQTGNSKAHNQMQKLLQQATTAEKVVSGKDPTDFGAEFEQLFKEITKGKLDWLTILQNYLNDMTRGELNFHEFNRRMIQFDMYFPTQESEKQIKKVALAFDVSGSVSEEQIKYFLNEMKSIKAQLNPEIIDVVSFNHEIADIFTIERNDNFDNVVLDIGGGTDLEPVFNYYKKPKNKPEFLLVFSDLEVRPIDEEDKPDFHTVWICIDNPRATVNFGKLIHITSEDINESL